MFSFETYYPLIRFLLTVELFFLPGFASSRCAEMGRRLLGIEHYAFHDISPSAQHVAVLLAKKIGRGERRRSPVWFFFCSKSKGFDGV